MDAHAQIGLEHQHAVVDGLEQRVQLAQVLLPHLDRGVAEHGERVGHAAEPSGPAAGSGARRLPPAIAPACRFDGAGARPVAIDVPPHDQAELTQAEQHHADQHRRAERCAPSFPVGGADILVDGADQPVQRVADLARQADVLREQALRLADDAQLLVARRDDAVRPSMKLRNSSTRSSRRSRACRRTRWRAPRGWRASGAAETRAAADRQRVGPAALISVSLIADSSICAFCAA